MSASLMTDVQKQAGVTPAGMVSVGATLLDEAESQLPKIPRIPMAKVQVEAFFQEVIAIVVFCIKNKLNEFEMNRLRTVRLVFHITFKV